jgi:hypothetical protein
VSVNPSTEEAEVGGWRVQAQSRLVVSKKKKSQGYWTSNSLEKYELQERMFNLTSQRNTSLNVFSHLSKEQILFY